MSTRSASEPAESLQLDARSVVSEDDAQGDTRSVASTQATTASLASRIASLTVDGFEDSRRLPAAWECDEDHLSNLSEQSEQDEQIVEISEAELIQELDRQELPLQVCSRLFIPGSHPPLRRLTWEQADSLHAQGVLILDGFISRDLATRLHNDTQMLRRQGRLQVASRPIMSSGPSQASIDRSARGDAISWLHPGRHPATIASFPLLMSAFQELQDDLQQILQLRRRTAEYQLACYPPNGAQYVKHRDALPDDGADLMQRKVTGIVYGNPGWSEADGGMLRLWLPLSLPDATHSPASSLLNLPFSSLPQVQEARSPLSSHGPSSCSGLPGIQSASKPALSTSGYESAGDTVSSRSEPLCSERPSWGPGRGGSSSITGSALDGFNDASTIPDSYFESSSNSSEDRENAALRDLDVHGEDAHEAHLGSSQTVLDIAPLAGRLVLFLSGAVDHAVLPSFAERTAMTAWFS
ncbi:hypothetical protein WJX84_004710 [Apatococcus fuscideae]|uniref:Prolyl 4-hydroxylase alpha subunit domain-containing protein n=1 Tax=Apatococcus fuscideae TaxID=2026836 RepID=A0AAW1TCX9_9CHLO